MSDLRATTARFSTIKVGWPLVLVLVAGTVVLGTLLSPSWTASEGVPALLEVAPRSGVVPAPAVAKAVTTAEPVILGATDPFASLRPSPSALLGSPVAPLQTSSAPAVPASGAFQPVEGVFAHLKYWGRLRSDGEWTYLLSAKSGVLSAPVEDGSSAMRVHIGSAVGTSYEVMKVDASGLQVLNRSTGAIKTYPWETGSP